MLSLIRTSPSPNNLKQRAIVILEIALLVALLLTGY